MTGRLSCSAAGSFKRHAAFASRTTIPNFPTLALSEKTTRARSSAGRLQSGVADQSEPSAGFPKKIFFELLSAVQRIKG
jgi:hypothetical protein